MLEQDVDPPYNFAAFVGDGLPALTVRTRQARMMDLAYEARIGPGLVDSLDWKLGLLGRSALARCRRDVQKRTDAL